MRIGSAIVLTVAFALLSAIAAGAAPVALPDTPAGRTAEAYLRAFNSDDPNAMSEFFTKHLSAAGLARRPMGQRLARSKEIKADIVSLKLERVIRSSPEAVTLLARTGAGEWVQLAIECESGPEGYLAGIRIDQTEPPAEEKTGAGGPGDSGGAARGGDASATPLTGQSLVAAIGAEVDRRAQADEFSGTVLVAHDGKPIYQHACGLAEKRFHVTNTMDTKFNLGSMDKLFTKVAIGQLIEQGKLSFDDTLGRYVEGFAPGIGGKVTIQHLLDMSSGLGDFFGPEFDAADKSRFRSNRDFLPLFVNRPLEFEPGTKRRYSNAGYITLGLVIEKITGRDYADYVREHVCRPAGMDNTDFYMSDDPTTNLAMGYTSRGGDGGGQAPGAGEPTPGAGEPTHGAGEPTRDEAGGRDAAGPRRENIFTRPARGSAAGGGYSTAGDLLRFANALAAGKLLGPAYTGWIFTGDRPVAGAAAATAALRGAIGIAGGAPGINGALEMDVASGYTIVVLSNYDPPSAESLARSLRGLTERAPRAGAKE